MTDLSAYILERHQALVRDFGADASPWVWLVLPMRYDPSYRMEDRGFGTDWRTVAGELLCPDILDESAVTALERSLGPVQTAAQLGQKPVRRGAGLIKTNKLESIPRAMLPRSFAKLVRAWDIAASDGVGCFTVGVLMGSAFSRESIPRPDRFYIIDVRREQTADPIALMNRLCDLMRFRIDRSRPFSKSSRARLANY